MLNSEEIQSILNEKPNTSISVESINAILPQIDQQAILQQEIAKYRIEVKSFNALSEVFQQMMTCQDSFAYLIYVNNSLAVFQPHNPSLEGHRSMTEAEANTLAAIMLAQLAKSNAESKVIAEVKALLSL